MNLWEFLDKNIHKKVDFDGAYGAQCVDLFRQYLKDVYEIKEHTGAVEGAKDLFLNHQKLPVQCKYLCLADQFIKAKPGWIAIWGSTTTNKYGHVAIVLEDKGGCLAVFEQNGFTQDGAKITMRNKTNLLGYMLKREEYM